MLVLKCLINYFIRKYCVINLIIFVQLELAELQSVTESKTERMGQVEELLNQIQHVAVKQAAAQSVKQTYHNMINVLKKVDIATICFYMLYLVYTFVYNTTSVL